MPSLHALRVAVLILTLTFSDDIEQALPVGRNGDDRHFNANSSAAPAVHDNAILLVVVVAVLALGVCDDPARYGLALLQRCAHSLPPGHCCSLFGTSR
jgi:hypothetical protein